MTPPLPRFARQAKRPGGAPVGVGGGALRSSRPGERAALLVRAELGNDAGIIGAALLSRATST